MVNRAWRNGLPLRGEFSFARWLVTCKVSSQGDVSFERRFAIWKVVCHLKGECHLQATFRITNCLADGNSPWKWEIILQLTITLQMANHLANGRSPFNSPCKWPITLQMAYELANESSPMEMTCKWQIALRVTKRMQSNLPSSPPPMPPFGRAGNSPILFPVMADGRGGKMFENFVGISATGFEINPWVGIRRMSLAQTPTGSPNARGRVH